MSTPTAPSVGSDPATSDLVDLLIVGGGPVGLYGAFYAGLRHMSVKIVDSLEVLGGQLMALYPEKYIYDVAGFPQVTAKDLVGQLAQQGLQFGAQPCLGETVQTLVTEADETFTLTTNKAKHRAKLVLIAAGVGSFTPRPVPIPNANQWLGRGLHYFIKDMSVFKDKRVLILGGGDSAIDWANMLAPYTAAQTLIHRRDKFRAHEDSVEKMMQTKTHVMLWHEIKHIEGDEQGVRRATVFDNRTKEETTIEVDAIVSNFGFVSALGPIKEWGLTIEKNQIAVDRLMQTNRPRVFSAGDICTYEGKMKLIATGFGEAATAVNFGKTLIDPKAKLFPGHSSERDEPVAS
jgi:ferredoxin/flavodoxin---NADP+ reductase